MKSSFIIAILATACQAQWDFRNQNRYNTRQSVAPVQNQYSSMPARPLSSQYRSPTPTTRYAPAPVAPAPVAPAPVAPAPSTSNWSSKPTTQYTSNHPTDHTHSGTNDGGKHHHTDEHEDQEHEHDGTLRHQELWETCENEIASSEAQLAALEAKFTALQPAGSAAGSLATGLSNLQKALGAADAADATIDLAALATTNSDQMGDHMGEPTAGDAATIFGSQSNIRDIKDIIQETQQKIASLQFMVDCLPSVDSLQTRIDDLAEIQGEYFFDIISEMVAPNDPLPDGTDTLWTQISFTVDNGISDRTDEFNALVELALADAGCGIGEYACAITWLQGLATTQTTDLATLNTDYNANADALTAFIALQAGYEADFDMQEVTYDYFWNNASANISMPVSTFEFTDRSFCVFEGEVVEFWLNATLRKQTTGEIYRIDLQDDTGTTVASASYTQNLADDQGRNFSIYYKARVGSDTQFTPVFQQEVGPTWDDFDALNFNIGYRTYNTAYPLSTTPETCGP